MGDLSPNTTVDYGTKVMVLIIPNRFITSGTKSPVFQGF